MKTPISYPKAEHYFWTVATFKLQTVLVGNHQLTFSNECVFEFCMHIIYASMIFEKQHKKIPVFHVCSRAILSESWQGKKSTTHKSGNLDEMRSDKMPVLTAEGDQREVLQEINVAIRLLLGSC